MTAGDSSDKEQALWATIVPSMLQWTLSTVAKSKEDICQTPSICSFVVVVQSLSRVWLFVTPWTAACQASLSFTILRSLLKLMSIKSVMPSKHLILCHALLLLPSIFPSIRVFSNELALRIRWPKYLSLFLYSLLNYCRLLGFKAVFHETVQTNLCSIPGCFGQLTFPNLSFFSCKIKIILIIWPVFIVLLWEKRQGS